MKRGFNNLALIYWMLGCASIPSESKFLSPPIVALKQSLAQSEIVNPPQTSTFTMFWPNDPWLQSGSWIVVESPEPQGPYVFYAQTTHNWIDIPITNSQRFFNRFRSEDYDPN